MMRELEQALDRAGIPYGPISVDWYDLPTLEVVFESGFHELEFHVGATESRTYMIMSSDGELLAEYRRVEQIIDVLEDERDDWYERIS
jgi:hypothetical protein